MKHFLLVKRNGEFFKNFDFSPVENTKNMPKKRFEHIYTGNK